MNGKTLRNNIILFTASIFIALLLCEIIVRAFNLAPEVVYIEKWRVRLSPNPKIGYEPIPNLDSQDVDVRYYSYRGMSNDMGFRDYNHPLEKPSGQKRVLVIGDSITQGLWINDDSKIFTAVMENRLQGLGHSVDVMNFGVSGYNTRQEVETLKDKGLQFKPDLVILAYCLNDKFQDDGGIYGSLLADQEKFKKEGKLDKNTKISPLVKHSDFLRYLKYSVLSVIVPKSKNAIGKQVNEFYKDDVAEYFGVLKELANQHKFDVKVFIFPDFGKHDENLLVNTWSEYPFAEEHERVISMASQNSLPYLDLYPLFQECHRELGRNVSYDRYHPNPSGSVCIGNKMADYLSDNWLTH